MKITRVEIFDIECPKRPVWNPVFIRIHTDEGIAGVGEAGLAYDWGHSAAAHMIKEIAEALLIGFNPVNTELLWSKMLREGFWGLGGGPVFYAAMSAIDTALWDIKAKALNVPLYQLLGGKTNGKLRTYASQLQFDWDKEVTRLNDPVDYGRAAEKAVAEGYDAVKVDPIVYDKTGAGHFDRTKLFTQPEMRLFRARLQAIRDAVGDDVDIIFECHSLPGVATAIQLGEMVEDIGCLYYEEPVNYLNSKLHDKVAKRVNVPIAGGERLYNRWGVRPYLEDQSLDVLQPDIGLCGGFTEAKKVCDYADVYDVRIQAHVCGGPVATAASLHLETAIPNFLIHEHHTYAIKDWNRELCIQDPQPVNGFFEVTETPGIGIDLNDEIVYRSPHMEVK
ncbi:MULTISPECIES: mandelate racemase/muconate lactonizing enzyme family protein [Paraglaciecola]|jgi:L-alanine-DL-glutamate epimerase-like enolase superfamily enzyme|uniref:D-galactonate dehydratase family member n=3 Tax=Paraglaciecola TaxID=1621534 RepID=A0A857JFE9_9ALTE|nr:MULTISPECIES: mandelate racemase/muconate lactonizing enzyme family protein [Paraglaciecola]AEE23586.1 Mandelate racemase/muconate lactonizing protein [Glaciecola sp. 4H-3-7+YE-5]MBN23956.1 mandelate racemase/muconate lactonizing enzyme family protein [Alteromonadaceae bacterium]MDO6559798.1 mandelate racemase/muconate lactonizing enzyme family protein [Paraglaciecola chathamensis]MDO6838335.1 mandelate racemase/muconate lactonizing enzyme family protein [Paraglaciecola chathamensis]QHJ1072|tara:strand:- start:2946 stop:4121 length:1176 start_codon:yes stop_codon:yes gene_type:complete